MIVFPFWLLTVFLALMLKWTLNLSAIVTAGTVIVEAVEWFSGWIAEL